MREINGFQLHYYLQNDSHSLDAFVRNKCEAELLSIIEEIASELDIDAQVIADIAAAGGFRDFWKFLGNNAGQIGLVIAVLNLILITVPYMHESESEQIEDELNRLKIEETQLNIQKLKNEMQRGNVSEAVAEEKSSNLISNLKINKRRSNFYATLDSKPEIEQIGISIVDAQRYPLTEEFQVLHSEFKKYVLSTNKLKSENIETEIEIISPVLREGRYKWKGLLHGEAITFDMQDHDFKDAVLIEDIPFQHGSSILCVLKISRELDELGDVKVSGYLVTTVIEKIDNGRRTETQQGRSYRHAKKMAENQEDLFE